MKKLLLILFAVLFTTSEIFSQANILVEAPPDNTTTQNRAPNGTANHAFLRACSLVLQSELTNLPLGISVTQFGFTVTLGVSGTPVSGNFTVYLQNTNDVSYQKGATWSNIITGMTPVYANVMTIPVSAVTTSIMLTLSTPFSYGGGGIYVAYDWASVGPFSAQVATYLAEGSALNPGGASANSASTGVAPASLGTTNFRPSFLFYAVNTNTNDMQAVGIEAPGKVAAMFNSPHTIKAMIKNVSTITQTNVPVNLNVGGANVFTNVQTIASLAPGATTLMSFAPFNPQLPGLNTISVTVNSDQNNANNIATYAQSVTCNQWAQNPATGNYTSNAVGFGAGNGILATPYLNPVTSTLIALRCAISNNAASVGGQTYGVLLNTAGVILATTNTITITNGMLATFQQVTFNTAQPLTANTTYYLGFAQMTGTVAYYPAGTQATSYLPPNLYYSTAITGGAFAVIPQNYGYFGVEAVFNPTITISAASQSITCGTSASVTAVSATNYSWSTGALTSSIVVSPTVTTNYTVTATNTLGCSVSTVATVTVNPMLITTSSNPSTVNCGASSTVGALSQGTYSWNTGPITASMVVTPTVTTNYSVVVSNSLGCIANANVVVNVIPLPVVASITSTFICVGSTVGVAATGASSYTWSAGNNTNSPAFGDTPTVTTVYGVIGTNSAGCVNTSSVTVVVQSFTNLNVSTTNTTICLGNTLGINGTGAATYTWTTNTGTVPGSSLSHTPAASGLFVYTLTGADAFGCSTTRTVNITVNTVSLTLTSNTAICIGASVTLDASGASNYLWNTGFQFPNLTVNPQVTTSYTVTGTGTNNCVASASVTVTVNPNPTVTASAQRLTMCKFESNTLTVTGATNYSWSTTGTSSAVIITASVATTNVYTVVGTDANGCSKTASVSIKVNTCSGLTENMNGGQLVSIYPNPNNGSFYLKTENSGNSLTVMISNALGAQVLVKVLNSDITHLNLEEQAAGLYLMTVYENGQPVQVSKIIKQ